MRQKGWNGWYYENPARLWLLLMLCTLMMIIGLACVTTLHVTLLLDDGSWHETTRECGKYLCVFSEMSSFSQKCGKCDFLLKIPGSYFTHNFSPQKVILRVDRRRIGSAENVVVLFLFDTDLTIDETFTFPVFPFQFSSVFHLSLLPMSLVFALGMNVDIVVLYEDSRAKLSLVITKTLRQRRN